MRVSFNRGEEISREKRSLPAELYNKFRIMLAHAKDGHFFVPIRAMQYMAVVDATEIIFVDGQGPREIEISWCEFRATERANLEAPVCFTSIYYARHAPDIMPRLQSEFLKAIALLESRQPKPSAATITPLKNT